MRRGDIDGYPTISFILGICRMTQADYLRAPPRGVIVSEKNNELRTKE
jgi:hypothetical protein